MMLLRDVNLVKEKRGSRRFDRDVERAELRIAGDLAVSFGNPEGIGRIGEITLPIADRIAGQERLEILSAVQMPEGLAKDRVEQAVERGRVLGPAVSVGNAHANPAGAGQAGEWIAITLKSSPIS